MKRLFILLPIILNSILSFSNEIIGPVSANVGECKTYNYFTSNAFAYQWEVQGGYIESFTINLTDATCVVCWDSPGLGMVFMKAANGSTAAYLEVTINPLENIPATPPQPVLGTSNICGSKRLDRVGNPPAGVKWYWQTSPTATSTSLGFGSSYNAPATGTYYLRARNDGGSLLWSTSASSGIAVTVNQIPATPPSPVITYFSDFEDLLCKTRAEIAKPSVPTGVSYYWQGINANGTSTSNSSSVYEVAASGSYYLRGKNNSANCWGNARLIEIVLNGAPKPAPPSIQSSDCYSVVLSREADPSDFMRHYWQGTNEFGKSGANHNNTFTVTTSGRYYLRKYNFLSQCWSLPSYIDITIDLPDIPATPSQNDQCGSTILTMPVAPQGVTYYWQTTYTGTATGTWNTNSTYIMNSDGAIFLRGLNQEGCWGEARLVGVNISEVQEVIIPDISYSCNDAGIIALRTAEDTNIYQLKNSSGQTMTPELQGIYGPGSWVINQNDTYSLSIAELGSPNTCAGDPRPIVISGLNVYPATDAGPDITGFANGSTIALTGMSPSGGTWSGTGISDPAANTFNAAGLSAGNYTITYSYTTPSACMASDSRVVTLVDDPSIQVHGSAYIMPGGKVKLSVENVYNAYQWKKNGVNISGADAYNYDVTEPGSYSVTVYTSSSSVTATPVVIQDATQRLDRNFIRTYSIKVPGVAENDDFFALSPSGIDVTTTYYDGLGRPEQEVATGMSPQCFDMVQPMEYVYGREPRQFLPYAAGSADGLFKTSALSRSDIYVDGDQYRFYQTADKIEHSAYPYADKDIERSPLARILKQGAPGAAWQLTIGNPVEYIYTSNTNSSRIKLWVVVNDEPRILQEYASGELYAHVAQDEEGHRVIEYKNKTEQMVVKRVQANDAATEWADTYYVYDDFGDLRFVLPPEAVKEIGDPASYPYTPAPALLNKWAFQYQYDGRRRMEWKKVPGAEPVYMVYDKRDRLVLT